MPTPIIAADAGGRIIPTNEPQIDPQAFPCPFCVALPEAELWHGGSPTKVMICCSQRNEDGCDVGPMVCGETHALALSLWNRRMPVLARATQQEADDAGRSGEVG